MNIKMLVSSRRTEKVEMSFPICNIQRFPTDKQTVSQTDGIYRHLKQTKARNIGLKRMRCVDILKLNLIFQFFDFKVTEGDSYQPFYLKKILISE